MTMEPRETEAKGKQRFYVLYPEKVRAKKFEKLKPELPEMLRRLQDLPRANGLVDQAEEQLSDFYGEWRRFRTTAMKCDQRDWLKEHVYGTPDFKNYDALKKSSSAYRTWKTNDNKRRWREMSEDKKESRRRQQRESVKASRAEQGWFDLDRIMGLAKRCLKDNLSATTVTYAPVVRLIRKHQTPEQSERWMLERVMIAMACLRYNPTDQASVQRLTSVINHCCAPGLDAASRAKAEKVKQSWWNIAKETYEASQSPEFTQMLADA